jgi:hypothetical protein
VNEEAHKVLGREVGVVVDSSQVARVRRNVHTFLDDGQVNNKSAQATGSTHSNLRVVQISVEHDDGVGEDVDSVLGVDVGCIVSRQSSPGIGRRDTYEGW